MKDVTYFQRENELLLVSTDPRVMDVGAVFRFLDEAKWWTELTSESLERALRNSLCFSLVDDGRQIGFARVITDYITYAYVCDVYVQEERRGHGLGTWLIQSVLEHPDLKLLKRISLITHDAQEFYLRFDFKPLAICSRYMERLR